MNDQQLLILGEFYLKKGNYVSGREIFTKLLSKFPTSFRYAYMLGKIEKNLKNTDLAINHLEHSRNLNPFHKPTLLLLSKCYSDKSMFHQSLECMVDAFLLSKETNDRRMDSYRKKIRKIAKKISNELDERQRNILIKDRLKYFNDQLKVLEDQFANYSKIMDDAPSHAEITLATIEEPKFEETKSEIEEIELPAEEIEALAEPTFTMSTVVVPPTPEQLHRLGDTLSAEIDDHIKEEDVSEISSPSIPESLIANVIAQDFGSYDSGLEEFRHHILFKSLAVEELSKIQQFSTIQKYAKGEVIHTPLEPIYGFSCVLEGRVRIYHQNESLMELETGAIIDEAELCNGDKYFFETRAIEPAKILMLNKAALLALCKRQHKLAVHFLWHFYKSLSLKINSIFESIIYQNPSNNIIWNLDRLQEVTQQRTLNELEIEYLTHRLPKTTKKKGEFLFKNHAHADHLYILLEGELELEHPYSKDVIEVTAGQFFSEIGLISNSFEHSMNAKVLSENAVYLKLDRSQLVKLQDPTNKDNFRMMEILWSILSRKYFEFLNFHFHLLKS